MIAWVLRLLGVPSKEQEAEKHRSLREKVHETRGVAQQALAQVRKEREKTDELVRVAEEAVRRLEGGERR